MRLHSNTLTHSQVVSATRHLPGVYATVSQHGSRSRARAFEVRLEGNGYARNSGYYGADSGEIGATWDEWGAYIAVLYALDPDGLWGSPKHPQYKDKADFDRQTGSRFDGSGTLPEDAHKRHNWQSSNPRKCKSCTAIQAR